MKEELKLEDIFNEEKRQGVKELIDKHKLEEASFRFYPEDEQWTDRHIFTLGAKWQQERSYSEEDMKEAYKYGRIYDMTSFEEWFEQFKKKQDETTM